MMKKVAWISIRSMSNTVTRLVATKSQWRSTLPDMAENTFEAARVLEGSVRETAASHTIQGFFHHKSLFVNTISVLSPVDT